MDFSSFCMLSLSLKDLPFHGISCLLHANDSQFLPVLSPLCPSLLFPPHLPIIRNSMYPKLAHHSPQHSSSFFWFSNLWSYQNKNLRKLKWKPQNAISFAPYLFLPSRLLLLLAWFRPWELESEALESHANSVLSSTLPSFLSNVASYAQTEVWFGYVTACPKNLLNIFLCLKQWSWSQMLRVIEMSEVNLVPKNSTFSWPSVDEQNIIQPCIFLGILSLSPKKKWTVKPSFFFPFGMLWNNREWWGLWPTGE